MYGIGTTGNLSHRSHRVQHDCIASPDAQLADDSSNASDEV